MFSRLGKTLGNIFRSNPKDPKAAPTFQREMKGKEALEKQAQEEAEGFARQRDIRMALQERIKEQLNDEFLDEAVQFTVQQIQRGFEIDSCRMQQEEEQEKAKKEIKKRKLRNLLLRKREIERQTERETEVERQTEQRLRQMEEWKHLQREAQEEANKEIAKRKLRNELLLEMLVNKKEEEKVMEGRAIVEEEEKKESFVAVMEAQSQEEITPPGEALMLSIPETSAEKLRDSLPEENDDIEDIEAAIEARAAVRRKEFEKSERKRAARIRKAPLRKPPSFFDIPDRVKRRTRFYQIVEKIDGTLDPTGLERRLVEKTPPTIEDFQLQSYLGEGSFGKVYRAQHRSSGKIFAIKAIEMHEINEREIFHCVTLEQRILRLVDEEQCLFLAGLLGSFQTQNHMCLALEFAEGGDLAAYADTEELPLDRVRFYSACMVLGIQFLHQHNIAHRDIKADNVLLYEDGYVKITDFGLCKAGMAADSTASSHCGTLFYMAPEIFKGRYTRSVDWWALGVTIYKLLTGDVPFYADTDLEYLMLAGREEPEYPDDLTEDTRDILENLLKKDPEQRLGAGEHGAEDVRKSPFFEGLDWEALEKKEIEPPFIPRGRAHGQPEISLKLKAQVEANVCEEAEWALVELNYPFSSASETEEEL
ncbi:serine/threonine-protein kinase N1 [Xenopus tropicalis]|uniref:Serine/threonine-protein kinase N1 n=1 Tax=Xenopus tropicalis TaxID=8364 RepID=A0A8J1IY09_XENTR|nr:serine/threonine-protein kinase N1 [Xenopus tropicalis]